MKGVELMRKLIHSVQNMRFRTKMILSHFSISLIPLLIFSAVMGNLLVFDAQNTSRSHCAQMVSQMSESIDVYIGTVDKMIDHIIGISSQDHQENAMNESQIGHFLDHLMQAYPEIAGIMIAYEDDSYIGAEMNRISRDPFIEEPWFRLAQERDGQIGIISSAVGRNVVTNTSYSADKIFTVVKCFTQTNRGCKGVVLIDIRHDILEQLLESISVGDNSFLYVTDSENNIVYTPTNPLVYRIDEEAFYGDSETNRIRIDASNYWVSNQFSAYTGWRSVGVISDFEYYQSMARVYSVLMLCILLCFVAVFFLSLKISNTVTRPLFALRRLMSKVEDGDFSVRFNPEYNDEIGELGNSFNHMLEQINTLIRQLYIEKQARLEAQLKTLQEQIKPHFLYNTLDTVTWMARDHGADDVVKLVEALTNMFRIGLSRGKDCISLKEEKLHVENYLYIQKIRYQDKLWYEIDIPEQFNGVIVPKLILQPLVENAIYHGIKLKRGGGTICVRARSEGNDLVIQVRDNGAGIDEERLALLRDQLRQNSKGESGMGFGMFYVAERIALYYGKDYTVSIDSVKDEGTTVTLVVPVRRKEGEKNV